MGKQERPGIGLLFRKVIGRTTPEDNGMLWVEGRMFDIARLEKVVNTYHLAEGAKDTGASNVLRRFHVSEVNRRLYEIEVRNFAERHGLDQEELLAIEPIQFFMLAAKTILSKSLIHSVRTSKSSPDKLEKTLDAIRGEIEKRAEDPKLSTEMASVLGWFHQTGFDEAVKAAQEQKS